MRVLVTAASRHSATAEIGEAIADELRAAGLQADFRRPEDLASVVPYDAIVLGSAIYTGRWLETARRFTERQHAVLRGRPTWLFSSGPIGEPLTPTEEPADGKRLLADLGAREHRVFAGKLNPEDLGWVERTITGMLKAPGGDFRNWDEIRAWARTIAASLETAAVAEVIM
jgi:menaquinone-dependent protoporphyrinogen oxidase